MAYIYRIWNDINNKSYIGKTERSIEKRWKERELTVNQWFVTSQVRVLLGQPNYMWCVA